MKELIKSQILKIFLLNVTAQYKKNHLGLDHVDGTLVVDGARAWACNTNDALDGACETNSMMEGAHDTDDALDSACKTNGMVEGARETDGLITL